MRQLGRKFVAVLGAGVLAAAGCAVAAILQWWAPALVALSMVAVCILATITMIRRDLLRTRANLSTALPTVAPATTQQSATSEVHLMREIAATVETAVRAAVGDASQPLSDTGDRVSAMLWLHSHHLPPSAPPLQLPGAMPIQFAALLDLVTTEQPDRVLSISSGSAGTWLAHAVAQYGGRTTLITDHEPEAAALRRFLGTTSNDQGTSVELLPLAAPGTPHSWLPWYDLAFLGHDSAYDLIIVCVPDQSAVPATRPVLPLLGQHLAPDGDVVTLESDADRPVAAGWGATPGWSSTSDRLPMPLLRKST